MQVPQPPGPILKFLLKSSFLEIQVVFGDLLPPPREFSPVSAGGQKL
jgi:hypothetical protein